MTSPHVSERAAVGKGLAPDAARSTVAAVNSEEMAFLGALYRNLVDVPLDPASDKRYVPLYGDVPDSPT